MLRMEGRPLSPQSGRTTIAQRFIAGNSKRILALQSVKRTTEINSRTRRFGIYLSPVSRALIAILLLVPSTQVPGYFRHVRGADENLVTAIAATRNEETMPDEIKILAEGFHSSINDPFVAVVRDNETYAALRKRDATLPSVDAEFFKANIMIAAFLGQRNTGGYSVVIDHEANGDIRISETAPGKGVMVPQMITSPFKIVSIAINGMPSVSLILSNAFQPRAQLYRISYGTFQLRGGLIGRTESFPLVGKLRVSRLGDLITLGMSVVGTGTERERMLRDSATGTIKDGHFIIRRASHGSLLDPPSGYLQITGAFFERNKLRLEINSAAINVPENYSGSGTIEAELVLGAGN